MPVADQPAFGNINGGSRESCNAEYSTKFRYVTPPNEPRD